MDDANTSGKLGPVAKTSGIGCLVGLLILLLGGLSASGSFLMHDRPATFLFGVVCVWGAPVWLVVVGVLAWRRDQPWRRQEVALVALVGVTFLLTLAVLR